MSGLPDHWRCGVSVQRGPFMSFPRFFVQNLLFFKRCLYELFAYGWSAVTYCDMLYNCVAIPRRSKKCYKCSAQLSVGFTAAVVAAGAAAAAKGREQHCGNWREKKCQ